MTDKFTLDLMQRVSAMNHASDKKCTNCVYYVKEYKDDFTLRHYGYGKVKIRPACNYCGNYGFVSHNPAAMCRNFEERINNDR